MNGSSTGHVVYPSANDFNQSESFTISFWMKKAGPNPAGAGTAFAFGLATSTDIWTAQNIFLLFEDGGQSTADSAAAKFYLMDQWFEFINTSTLDRRIPHILNGDWHHLVFVYDATTSTVTTYVDGSVPTNLPDGFGKFTNNGGVANISTTTGLVVGGRCG